MRKAHSLIFKFINFTFRLPVKIFGALHILLPLVHYVHDRLSAAEGYERAHRSERVGTGLVRLAQSGYIRLIHEILERGFPAHAHLQVKDPGEQLSVQIHKLRAAHRQRGQRYRFYQIAHVRRAVEENPRQSGVI